MRRPLLLLLLLSAFYFQASANITMGSYRWRNNDGSETTATWKNAADQPISNVTKSDVFRVRMQLLSLQDQDNSSDGFMTLYYTTPGGTPQKITDIDEGDFMLVGSTPAVSEGEATTRQMTYDGTKTFVSGRIITSTSDEYLALSPGTYTEYEWVIKGGSTLQKNTSYSFFLKIDGIEGSIDNSLGTVTSHATLPLKLLSFDARLTDKKVNLHWRTAEEENVSHFEIEKSTDGNRYAMIGKQQAAFGTGNKAYSHTDNEAVNANTYYRLKMVDKNGSFTYSNISLVKTGDRKNNIAVYPNPAKDKLNISVTAETGLVQVMLQDANGRTLKKFTAYSDGRVINEVADISSLQRGIYFISFNGQTVRFVKD